MSWPAVAALAKTTPIVIPVAALEQHGHHLPVFTDSMLLGEIARRAERALKDRALFAPLVWLGNSEHHLDFPGTLSAAPRTYLDLLADLVENFITHGFTRIVVINGHGGNVVPAQQALFEVRQRHRARHDLALLFSSYWGLSELADGEFHQQIMGHACEWETSMMLALRPDLVGDYLNAAPVDTASVFDPVYRAWTTKDRSTVGHIGAPHLATAAKGERLLERFSRDLIALLERVAQWNGSHWS